MMQKRWLYGVATIVILVLGVYMARENVSQYLVAHASPRTASVIGFDKPAVFFSIGNYYFGGGMYDVARAKEAYKKALELSGDSPQSDIHYQLARIYFIEGDFYNALYEIDKEIVRFPENKRSYYVRGLIYGFMRQYEKAEDDFLTFIAWKKNGWAAYNDLAWIYFMEGEFEGVRVAAEGGLRYHPDNPWLNNTLGVALLNLGFKEEALRRFLNAQVSFGHLTKEDWGKAYPGNDPRSYDRGFASMGEQIKKNIALTGDAQVD